MARLPLADWKEDLTDARIRFLRNSARFVPPEPAEAEGVEGRSERIAATVTNHLALLEAADLAFATDRTPIAIDCIGEATRHVFTTESDVASVALQAAATGTMESRLVRDQGFALSPFVSAASPRLVPIVSVTPEGLDRALDLTLATVASGAAVFRLLRRHSSEDPVFRPGQPIVQALAWFDGSAAGFIQSNFEAVQHALWINAEHWAEELRLHRRDSYHWDQARVRGGLIDFRRLAFEVAVRRSSEGADFIAWRSRIRRREGLAEELEAFVIELAGEILNSNSRA